MSIVKNIQLLCKERSTSVPKLEKELGFSNGSMYNWDKNSPSIDKLQKVADYFTVSTDYLLLGFDKTSLVQFVNSIKGERSIEEFSKNTGIDVNELSEICLGQISEPPSLDTIERIANSSIDFILLRELDCGMLMRFAGYRKLSNIEGAFNNEHPSDPPVTTDTPLKPLTPKDERDIAKDLEKILSNLESDNALAFNGEPMDDETKELMRISLENSMRLAKQIAKKKFTPKKYR